MGGAGKTVGGRVARGQWGGAKKGGGRGWGKGMGRVVGKGVGRGINQSFEQNRYRYIEFGYRNAHYETKLANNRDFQGDSPILEEIPLQ